MFIQSSVIYTFIYISTSISKSFSFFAAAINTSRSRLSWKCPLAPMTMTYHWLTSNWSGVEIFCLDWSDYGEWPLYR